MYRQVDRKFLNIASVKLTRASVPAAAYASVAESRGVQEALTTSLNLVQSADYCIITVIGH